MSFRRLWVLVLFLSLSSLAKAQSFVHFDSHIDSAEIGNWHALSAAIGGHAFTYLYNVSGDTKDYYGSLHDERDTALRIIFFYTLPGIHTITITARDRYGVVVGRDTAQLITTYADLSSKYIGTWYLIGYDHKIAQGDTLQVLPNGRYFCSSGFGNDISPGAWTANGNYSAYLYPDNGVGDFPRSGTLRMGSDTLWWSASSSIFRGKSANDFYFNANPPIASVEDEQNSLVNIIGSNLIITLREPQVAAVQIANLLGHCQSILDRQTMPSGSHSFQWLQPSLASGVYFLDIAIGNTHTRKAVTVIR